MTCIQRQLVIFREEVYCPNFNVQISKFWWYWNWGQTLTLSPFGVQFQSDMNELWGQNWYSAQKWECYVDIFFQKWWQLDITWHLGIFFLHVLLHFDTWLTGYITSALHNFLSCNLPFTPTWWIGERPETKVKCRNVRNFNFYVPRNFSSPQYGDIGNPKIKVAQNRLDIFCANLFSQVAILITFSLK